MRAQLTLTLTIMVLTLGATAYGAYCGGSGTSGNPYLICTAADMNEIGANTSDWSKHFKLVADINLADYTGTSFNIIGNSTTKFTGVFDGNGCTISNFTYECDSSCDGDIGIFGYVDSATAVIKNLTLTGTDVDVNNSYNIGGLVGYNKNGEILNCNISGSVIGESYGYANIIIVGGLVGRNGGTISCCHSTCDVDAIERMEGGTGAGGLVGHNSGTIEYCSSGSYVYARTSYPDSQNCAGGLAASNSDEGTITYCYSYSLTGEEVSGAVDNEGGQNCVGGLVAYNDKGTIEKCYSTIDVNGVNVVDVAGQENYVGGLVGWNYHGKVNPTTYQGTITDCYAQGDVDGKSNTSRTWDFVGGLVGFNSVQDYIAAQIDNCYATGAVTEDTANTNAGGLVGASAVSDEDTATDSFWDVNTTGQSDSNGGVGLPTTEMQDVNTYLDAGWDFNDVWMINEGVDYPRFLYWIPDYDEWVSVNKPSCWLNPRQCHGDADGAPYGKFNYWVSIPDLDILEAAWNKTFEEIEGKTVRDVDPNCSPEVCDVLLICADFDHAPYGKDNYRVSIPDLDILAANWNIPVEPNCLGCQSQ